MWFGVHALHYHSSDVYCNTRVIHESDEIEDMEEQGARLRRLREAAGFTQAKLAAAAGVSQGTIGNVESGLRGYGRSLINIARVLGVSPEYLTGESDAAPEPSQLLDATAGSGKAVQDAEALVARSNQVPFDTGRERTVSETEWALLQDFALLPEDEKQTLRMRLAEKARDVRQKADEMFFGKHRIPPPVTDSRVAEAFGAAPQPTGAGSYKRITPVPEAPRPARKRVAGDD
jgi:transcriptional regulator with XRE-family HTH domain